jgi:hypothetical protein
MKRVTRSAAKDDIDFGYQKAQQDLREQDLKRYGIQTVFVDHYSEITDILKEIEHAVLANHVFISGSADFYEGAWPKVKIDELAYKLSNQLVKEAFRVTSGFGLGIGSSVINGALDEIYCSKFKHIDEHLCLRPFPQGIEDAAARKAKWKRYREEMLEENGVAIFMAGNKRTSENDKVLADGCLQEYQIAKEKGCVIIPIGSTGDAAAKIYAEVKANIDQYPYLEPYLDMLGTETDVDKLVSVVIEIAKDQRQIQ